MLHSINVSHFLHGCALLLIDTDDAMKDAIICSQGENVICLSVWFIIFYDSNHRLEMLLRLVDGPFAISDNAVLPVRELCAQ